MMLKSITPANQNHPPQSDEMSRSMKPGVEESKMMKKFILKLAIFCILPISLLYVVQTIVDSGLRQSKYFYFIDWNEIYHGNINADVLIQGSSRARWHISPAILDSVFQLNTYNLGMDGWPFNMQLARFKIYLQHNNKPKYIIHSVSSNSFSKRPDLYQYQQFLPYLNDTIIQNSTKGYRGEFKFLHYYFPLYKYNCNLDYVLKGILSYFHLYSNYDTGRKYKGYEGRKGTWDNSFDKFAKLHPNGVSSQIDEEIRKEFEEYLAYCAKNNIKVIMVYSPEYYKYQNISLNRKEVIQLYVDLAKKYNHYFYDYSNGPVNRDKFSFINSQHLNITGAEVFSKQLAQDLKAIVK